MASIQQLEILIQQSLHQDEHRQAFTTYVQERFATISSYFEYQDNHRLVEQLINYIGQTPVLLKKLLAVLHNTPIVHTIRHMVEHCCQLYSSSKPWAHETHSLVNLLDEAYLCHRLLEDLADYWQMISGASLISTDLTTINVLVHSLIGEPRASELDAAMERAVQDYLLTVPQYSDLITLSQPRSQLMLVTGFGANLGVRLPSSA